MEKKLDMCGILWGYGGLKEGETEGGKLMPHERRQFLKDRRWFEIEGRKSGGRGVENTQGATNRGCQRKSKEKG